jgi:2-haloacid dehalogenase
MLKSKKPIRHIFLDVGDTLLTLGIPPGNIYLDVLRKYQLIQSQQTDADLKHFFSDSWVEMNSRPNPDGKDRYFIHPDGQDGWWKELISLFLEKATGSKDLSLSELVYNEIFEKFENENLWNIEPGFFELQKFAASKKIHLGIISNWDYRLRGLLERKQLSVYFSPILISAEFGYEKPSKKIFQKAEELSGVSPEELVYVGDKPELDYHIPLRLGWNPFVIDPKQKINLPSISTLSELIPYLENQD